MENKIEECLTCIYSIYDKHEENWNCDLKKKKIDPVGTCEDWENEYILKLLKK